jgi:hypothetical protein
MLSLIGTFITQGPGTIRHHRGQEEEHAGHVPPEAIAVYEPSSAKKIYQDRVEIERNGKLEVLKLDDDLAEDWCGCGNSFKAAPMISWLRGSESSDKGLENLHTSSNAKLARSPTLKMDALSDCGLFAIKTGRPLREGGAQERRYRSKI